MVTFWFIKGKPCMTFYIFININSINNSLISVVAYLMQTSVLSYESYHMYSSQLCIAKLDSAG